MNIDLVYYFREVNHYYYLNGPEKVNGNIVNNSPSYQFSSGDDVVTKINQMIASLGPDITNVSLVTSELYTGDIQVNTYRGELNVSSAPDYTELLTNIDNDLKNIAYCFTSNLSTPANAFNNSLIQGISKLIYCFSSNIATSANVYNTSLLNALNSKLTSIDNKLKQSISPDASITDVISALNTNIHNDLTNINTTENNKDTVLIIDGQQEFKLRKDDE